MSYPRHNARIVMAGLVLGLLLLAGLSQLAGFALSSAAGAPNQATSTPTLGTPTPGTPTGSPEPTETVDPTDTVEPPTPTPTATLPVVTAEPPEIMAPEPCHVVGSPFQLEPGFDGTWAYTTVQNVGASPATLSALQIGWSGDAALRDVTLEHTARDPVALYAGTALSPAFIRLSHTDAGEAAIEPGESVRLGLRFDDAGDVPDLGPSILFMREGCTLALGAGKNQCALTMTDVRPSGNDPRRVVLSITNTDPEPQQLAALDVRWPEATNGALAALYINGQARRRFEPGLASSPAVLELDRLLDEPVVLAPGEPTSVWLEFANPVAERPYDVTAVTQTGCQATATTWLDAPECGVQASDFTTRGRRMTLRLSNIMPVTQTLASLDVFWPDGTNGPLVAALLDGQEIWSGQVERAPASITIAEGAAIAGDSTAALELVFDPSSVTDGSPSGDAPSTSIASGDYSLTAGFTGGCVLVFSTRHSEGPIGCSVSAGDLARRGEEPEVQVSLSNTGAEATLRRLAVSWPARNGALTEIWFGTALLYSGAQAPTSDPFTLLLDETARVALASNETVPLRLRFVDRASQNGYALSLSFDDAEGEPCSEILITPPATEADCDLAVTRIGREIEFDIEVFIVNRGSDEVELHSLWADWPTGEGLNYLVNVHMVDGDDEFLLWAGNMRQSPATIPLNAERAGIIDPGEEIRLRLHFTQLVGVTDPTEEFRLTVITAEGCRASYPDNDVVPRPEHETFNGMILDLPAEDLWSAPWTIEAAIGQERQIRHVIVDEATRLEPPAVTPEPGDIVRVEAIRVDGSWRAVKITFRSADQRAHFIGRITDMDPSADITWILIDAYQQRIRIVDATHVNGVLQIGAKVDVEGMLGSNGTVTATRIQVLEPDDEAFVTVRGIVQQDGQTADDLQPGLQVWYVSKYRVEVDTNTVDSTLVPHDRLPAAGDRVEVKGRLRDSTIVASKVSPVAAPQTTRLDGILIDLPPGGHVGTWTVKIDDGRSMPFIVESASVVDTRSAPAVPGMAVQAVVQELGGGRRVALSVRLDWPD